MIQLIAGGKGEGKTKRLIEMANNEVKTADGHIVFIDDDSRHIYDLHYDIRFIDTSDYPIYTKDEFFGFVCGILSSDRDIQEIYIDGLSNIVKGIENDDTITLTNSFEKLSQEFNVNFVITMNLKSNDLPEEIKQYMVA